MTVGSQGIVEAMNGSILRGSAVALLVCLETVPSFAQSSPRAALDRATPTSDNEDSTADSSQTSAASQAPAASPWKPTLAYFARDWTRADSWSYFQPKPGGGDPNYGYIANRLQFGIEGHATRYDFVGALQYVQFGGLPTDASGPGQLGIGATYYDTNGGTDPGQLYLRYANITFKDVAPGLNIRVGRMGYTSGAETASGDAKIEAVKRQRLDSRMIGEFEWSIFQRGFDGGRVDYTRPAWQATAAAYHPTQGGFERNGDVEITDITVLAGTAGVHPGQVLPHTELMAFAYRYDDTRAVTARPDNEGRTAASADVRINTFGGTLAGAYPAATGQADALLWIVGQNGTWYDRSHRAYAFAAEAGYQWTDLPWKPWVRAGIDRASGDDDPTDTTHGTFFPMLPTARKYSLSSTYAFMNLDDRFVQAFLRPADRLNIRVDLHLLNLVEAADRWYTGSGATQSSGTIFGYSGRASQGATPFGTVIEGSADLAIRRHWSVNGYIGYINGRDVVERTFAGDRLTFAYLENVLTF